MIDRRLFLQSSAAGLLGAGLAPGISFANAPTDNRFVLVFLRGALDSLHALVPYDDINYRNLRPRLAVSDPLKIGGYFGLHPDLKGLHDLYRDGDLTLIPATSTSYRERSHFDAQNLLENGSGKPFGAHDGWLNRAIAGLGETDKRLGLSLGARTPLILKGDANIQTWSESELPDVSDVFLDRLDDIYASDPLFSSALMDARAATDPMLMDPMMRQKLLGGESLRRSAEAAGQLLAMAEGPRIAVLESQGWDTHFDQMSRLSRLFKELDSAVANLKSGLNPVWDKTVIMVVSEFGRTVAENGNRGTDHGTGGLVFLAGGAVKGGRVAGDWPGLEQRALYEGRDLMPVNSCEAIFKTMLMSHLGVSEAHIAEQVFPSNPVAPMGGLLI